MRAALQDRGFDFECPSIAVAWAAFKTFLRVPLNGVNTITVGVEFLNYEDRDDVLWVSFMRRVGEAHETQWSCGCLLSRTVPKELTGKGRWWWVEHGTIEQWISEVESMSEFLAVISLDAWQWEGFSE